MTSPALIVLFLAHACSIFGTASEQVADYDSKVTDINMRTHHTTHNVHNLWTNIHKNLEKSNSELNINKNYNVIDTKYNIDKKYDDIYTEDTEVVSNIDLRGMNLKLGNDKGLRVFDDSKMMVKKRYKRHYDLRCIMFEFNPKDPQYITHPHERNNKTYYSDIDCDTVINASSIDEVIHLTFVDEFHIESHPDCIYDYLEIRDGLKGYAKPLGRFCGTAFPPTIVTSGPYAWLKFHADDTIEYEGFKINIEFKKAPSQRVPDSCYIKTKTSVKESEWFGEFDLSTVDKRCKDESPLDLDILWTIETPVNTKIYLNFTEFKLANPNECGLNVVEVFGAVPEMKHILAQYCGSIANSVSTKETEGKEGNSDAGNVMHVRLMLSKNSKKDTRFSAQYTAYRTLNPNKDERCTEEEFDCDDNTCIHALLKCDGKANCRLKTDEDSETCKLEAESTIKQPHIMVILIIFSLILSAMSFVFLFKCIRKLYQDHKIIKEHIRESCEDRLDMVSSRLTLDAKRLQRDSEPRASLERENQANEMFKRKRDSFSKRKPTSIDSDFIQETHLDLDDEPWRREVDSVPTETDDIRVERNGRTRRSEKERQDRRSERASERASERQAERRSDMSKKEESIRSKRESEEREKEKREIRDVSVGAPDTKESGCQTRESLFQEGPPPSSDGSGTTGTNSRGFSTFGYSGATIARPSPPATNTSEIKIELLKQVPRQDSVKIQKKTAERRPISTETTRSAPDVIIVSKPIR